MTWTPDPEQERRRKIVQASLDAERARDAADPHREMKAYNRAWLDRLGSWTLRVDYIAYLEYHYGEGAHERESVDDPHRVAMYVADDRKGRWPALLLNRRSRDRGLTPRYTTHNSPAPAEKDVIAMTQQVAFENRRHPDAESSLKRFAEATRSAAFNLQLGIREIRLLKTRPWNTAYWLQTQDLGAMQKMIDKGLLVHDKGENPRLTEAGELVRKLLILSNHIVEAPLVE